jgi:hypothetical protein
MLHLLDSSGDWAAAVSVFGPALAAIAPPAREEGRAFFDVFVMNEPSE